MYCYRWLVNVIQHYDTQGHVQGGREGRGGGDKGLIRQRISTLLLLLQDVILSLIQA